jgi:hypothetical protein
LTPVSATVAQWELTIRLRARRKELGMSSDAIAKAAGFTRSYWSSVENDHNVLTREKLQSVLNLFDFGRKEQQELLALRVAASEHGWWMDHASVCGDNLTRFVGMEHGADSVRVYQSLIFPELLQCESYARALVAADLFVRPAEINRLVQIRMRRQERLRDADPLRYTAIVSHAALRQQVGGPETQRAQLRHVADLMRAHPDHVDLRVLPETSNGRGIFGASTFQLLDFPSGYLPSLGWHESVTFRGFIEDPDRLNDFGQVFDSAQDEALSRAQTLALLDEGGAR